LSKQGLKNLFNRNTLLWNLVYFQPVLYYALGKYYLKLGRPLANLIAYNLDKKYGSIYLIK